MLERVMDNISEWMTRGGPVMWPLLALSVTALTLIFERCWFWVGTHSAWGRHAYVVLARRLRAGEAREVGEAVAGDGSVYGRLLRRILEEGASESVVAEALDDARHRMERYMSTLSTIITAAPMLGILGTVTGIISAFNVLGNEMVSDPKQVAPGIAEALLTTVFGLVIAIPVLFPYNAFRVQIDRALGRLENLAEAAKG